MPKMLALTLTLLLCVGAPAVAQDNQKPEGTWYVKVLFEGSFQLSFLQNFTSDGRTTQLLPFGPGQNEGDTRVGCMGEWRMRPGPEPKTYDFTSRCLYDQSWDSAYGEIRAILVLNKAGDRFNSRFTYTDWLAGEVLYSGEGVMTAERLVIKPLR